MILFLYSWKNYMQFNARHDFSVWLRIGSNPPDINQFRSRTGNVIFLSENKDWKI